MLRALKSMRVWLAGALAVAGAAFMWAALPAAAYDRYSVYEPCRGDAYWDELCPGYDSACAYPRGCYREPPFPPRHRWRSDGWEGPRHGSRTHERRAHRPPPPLPGRRPERDAEQPARQRAETEPETGGEDAGKRVNSRREAAENGEIPRRFRDLRNTVGHTVSAIASGAELYQTHCAACHGPRGAGDGPKAQRASARMPDLGFTVEQDYATDAYLIWTIFQGGEPFGTDKPGFEDTLSERQAWRIIAYLRAGFPQTDTRRTAGGLMPPGSARDNGGEDR